MSDDDKASLIAICTWAILSVLGLMIGTFNLGFFQALLFAFGFSAIGAVVAVVVGVVSFNIFSK